MGVAEGFIWGCIKQPSFGSDPGLRVQSEIGKSKFYLLNVLILQRNHG